MKPLISFLILAFLFSCGNATESKKNTSSDKIEISSSKDLVKKEVPSTSELKIDSVSKDIAVTTPNPEQITDITTAKSSPVRQEVSVEENVTEVANTAENSSMIEKNITEIANNTTKEERPAAVERVPELKSEPKKTQPQSTQATTHNDWDALLKKYVDDKGNVAYASFKKDDAKLTSYLEFLAKNEPSSSWSKNEKLAYYINLYNAATVKLIIDNYPTKSIKDIKSPWGKKWVKVGGQSLSLGNIEHKILRKMNEPRIHFAINCASYSCPKLVNSAFTAAKMESQLQKATKGFIDDPTRNTFKDNQAQLSEIFKWYKGDFTDNGTVLEYISKYTEQAINTNGKINYLKYDWSLNESK